MGEWDNYCDEIGGVCKDMEAQAARIAELEKMAEARKLANRLLEQERNELEAERDRFREALEKIAQWDMLARSQKGLIAIIEVLKDTARETLEGTGDE